MATTHLRTFGNRNPGLTFEELTQPQIDFSTEEETIPEKFFRLELAGKNFGLLYVGPNSYTIAWNSVFNFIELDYDIQHGLRNILGISDYRSAAEDIVVTLVSSGKGRPQEYQLSNLVQREKFYGIMNDPNAVTFARYDMTFGRMEYSFTAENPLWKAKNEMCEAALRLPRHFPLTTATMAWIIDHYSTPSHVTMEFDMRHSVAEINRTVASAI